MARGIRRNTAIPLEQRTAKDMTESARIEQLETTLRIVWGAMLAASLTAPENRYIQAAFEKADRECRKTGLLARQGVQFIEAD
jgi:hypothetical protein